MKCRICGFDCPPGAKICRDCVSARKRAFAQTVTQPLLAAVGAPTVGEPRFAPKPLRPRAANDSKVRRPKVEPEAARAEPVPALPLTAVPRKFSVVWLLLGVVVAAVIVGLVLRTVSNGARGSEEAVVDATETPDAPAVVAVAPPVIHEAPVESAIPEAPPKLTPTRPQRRAVPHVDPPSPVIVAPAAAPEPAPVVRAPAPPPRAVEPPRTDPWQALNEGLAHCAREPLFDRIGCEQKLRLQYCGNSWGLVPQCPIGPATDHGQ
jgi:hypothetical protein